MALRSNYAVTNNNHKEAMPFLQSFRQTKFDATPEEQTPEIYADNFGSNFVKETKSSVDANANVGIDAAKKSDNKINYDNMYFTDEEIPVMGYTSGNENSSMQLLESQGGETDQPIHKLMPLPSVGTPKPEGSFPYLVINDFPSITAEQGPIDNLESDSGSNQSHKSDLTWSSDSKSDLFDQYSRIREGGGHSESSSESQPCTELSDSGSSAAKGPLVSEQTSQDGSELVKLSLDSTCRDSGKRESEGSIDSSSDSDEVESPQSGCATKNVGSSCKFVADAVEPIHMTLEEVRSSLRSLNGYPQSVPSATSAVENACMRRRKSHKLRGSRMHFGLCLKPKTHAVGSGESASERSHRGSCPYPEHGSGSDHAWISSKSLKHTLCNWFGIAKCGQIPRNTAIDEQVDGGSGAAISCRALPPVPQKVEEVEEDEDDRLEVIVQPDNEQDRRCDDDARINPPPSSRGGAGEAISDFASSIQKVKDCGWYWGPISGEMAEKILSNEPDGSFILRDSSDEYYIFSLTFKLNGFVRHVRIEHEQGNFSFGTFTKFKSHTIVEFIENAVQHSRSGRYLFFIHRRPVLGPMRVQLLHPVSRFKQVQSLQHTCRFTILKVVRRDLIECLPIPKRLKDYLNTPHYYTEQMQEYQNIFMGGSGLQLAPTNGDNASAQT